VITPVQALALCPKFGCLPRENLSNSPALVTGLSSQPKIWSPHLLYLLGFSREATLRQTRATIVLMVLVILGLSLPGRSAASDLAKVYDLGDKCKAGKQGACRELAKIALEDQDAEVRLNAVYHLTDQQVLAKIAAEDKDGGVRGAAVLGLTDQTLLAKIAVDEPDQRVREAALYGITDLTLLGKIAAEDKVSYVRSIAMGRRSEILTDAASRGDLAVVSSCLDQGVSVDSTNPKDGFTALMTASENGHIEVVRLLLDKGANVNANTPGPDYVLMPNGAKAYAGPTTSASEIASMTGGTVKHGDQITALSLASENGHQEIREMLIKAGGR